MYLFNNLCRLHGWERSNLLSKLFFYTYAAVTVLLQCNFAACVYSTAGLCHKSKHGLHVNTELFFSGLELTWSASRIVSLISVAPTFFFPFRVHPFTQEGQRFSLTVITSVRTYIVSVSCAFTCLGSLHTSPFFLFIRCS